MNAVTLNFKDVQKELENDEFAVSSTPNQRYPAPFFSPIAVFRSSLRLENLYRQGFEVENASFSASASSLAENTFPIDRWCRDIILSIISQSVLFAAVTVAIGFHPAALAVFIACVVLSIVYLVLCKAKNLRPSIDLLMSWQYRHTLGALFLIFPCLPG